MIEPNWIPPFDPPTGPPFAPKLLGPFAIVTDGFRLWSFEPPLTELPCAIAGAETAGTAGGIENLPFTGETEDDFPCCCTGAEPPTATAGEGEEPVAMGGDETAFFAVEAYDALVVFEAWLAV